MYYVYMFMTYTRLSRSAQIDKKPNIKVMRYDMMHNFFKDPRI